MLKLLIDRTANSQYRQPPKVGDFAMWMRANSKITKITKQETKKTSLGNFEQYSIEVEYPGRFENEYKNFKFPNPQDHLYVGLDTDK